MPRQLRAVRVTKRIEVRTTITFTARSLSSSLERLTENQKTYDQPDRPVRIGAPAPGDRSDRDQGPQARQETGWETGSWTLARHRLPSCGRPADSGRRGNGGSHGRRGEHGEESQGTDDILDTLEVILLARLARMGGLLAGSD